jgi:outer membrane protein assembly factor BamA
MCAIQSTPCSGQAPGGPTGLEIGAVPAINYDADEGFGYGAIAELYQYGDGARQPYLWTLQPTVFLTTEGRRDLSFFFDGPHVLAEGWRLSAFAGTERQIATPYYGVGNDAAFDESLVTDANPYFYRFGRTRHRLSATAQKSLSGAPMRALFGVGMTRSSVKPVPKGEGTTLLADELGTDEEPEAGWSNYVRVGLIWDTRDRETGPRRGAWSDVLLQFVQKSLASDWSYTRWTVTDRRYFSLAEHLVFAHRVVLQGASGDVPLRDLHGIGSSFKSLEGLGGAKSVRGVPKNRYVGKGVLIWNAELRWRAADFRLWGKSFHLVVSGFVDSGRVWAESIDLGELLDDHHRGIGGGLHVGMGENFVVAYDWATSEETGLPLYIGLGYLF